MKKAAFVLTMMVLLAIALPVFAQEFPDVPPDHWAYQAVQELISAGIVQGYPDGTYGGKRAMTRYEFAEAMAKAIPAIEQKVKAMKGEPGPAGPPGPAGTGGSGGVTPEQFAALQKLVDEFRDELAALGVDVEALRRDVAALNERVTALEAEVARVRFTGTADVIGRGEVRNNLIFEDDTPVAGSIAIDRDGRRLAVGASVVDQDNPIANSGWFDNLAFGMKAKAGDNANVNAIINAGNYMNFALQRMGNLASAGSVSTLPDFLLWNMNAEATLHMGPLSTTQVMAGRYSMQLTPLTMKFVDPDCYAMVPLLDSGDFVLDGAKAMFNLGKVGVMAFAAKAAPINTPGIPVSTTLMSPNLQLGGSSGINVQQLAGARVTFGSQMVGLGLTWYEAGLGPGVGRDSIYGADVNAKIGQLGFMGEYAKSSPNTEFDPSGVLSTENFAWNANLSYMFGKLGLGAGYLNVKQNYIAPGYWLRTGAAVNLQNIKGVVANASYDLGNKLTLVAAGQFLTPDVGNNVMARTAVSQGPIVSIPGLDKLTYWKAGLKYALTDANSVDLGYEESRYQPLTATIGDTRERYVTIGIGHNFNANSSLKLLYQILDVTSGDVSINQTSDYRGGVAAAQMELKY